MKKQFLAAAIALASCGGATACLNIFTIDSSGKTHFAEHYFFSKISFNQNYIAGKVKALQSRFTKGDYRYENISDFGAYLLMSGRLADGLHLFRALIQKHPSDYAIRANLAVAYELNGNIDSALYWEKLAIAANPRAHNGSEWIHLKILEAKKKLQADSTWCLTHAVTGVVDSVQHKYRRGENEFEIIRTFENFIEQLTERLPFTYGNDAVMGKLLFELGDAYQAMSVYRSYYCYALAQYFYPALQQQCSRKMERIKAGYPVAATGKKSILSMLTGQGDKNREMYAPEDSDVNSFIQRIIKRPAIQNRRLNSIPVAELIERIG